MNTKLFLLSFLVIINLDNICFSQTNIFEKFIYNPYGFSFYSALESPNLDGYYVIAHNRDIIKIDLNGSIQQVWSGPISQNFVKLIKTADNNIVLLGWPEVPTVTKLDLSFNILWSKKYDLSYGTSQRPYNIYLTPDEGFLIIGTTISPTYPFAMKIDKYGNQLWSKVYKRNVQYSSNQVFRTALWDQNGNYYIVGWTYGESGYSYINKMDNTGNLKWSKRFIYQNNSVIYSLKFDIQQANLYLSISDHTYNAIVKMDTSGGILWDKEYSNSFTQSLFFNHNTETNLIAQSDRGFNIYSFDTTWTPTMARSFKWTNISDENYINKDLSLETSDNGMLMFGNYSRYVSSPPPGHYIKQPLIMKLDNSLYSACHTFPDSIYIVSINQYTTDTMISSPANCTADVITDYPFAFSTQTYTDSLICPENSKTEYGFSNRTLKIYPNPSKGTFTIDLQNILNENNESYLIIFNVMGEKVYEQNNIKSNQKTINIDMNKSGLFFIKIECNEINYYAKVLVD